MNRKIALVPALLAALALPACSKDPGPTSSTSPGAVTSTNPQPTVTLDDEITCTGTLTWNAGTMPAPHSYEWSITIDNKGTASFTYTPGFVSEFSYQEDNIPLDPDKAAALCDAVENAAPDDGSEGGPTITWNLNDERGHTTDTDATVAAARDLLGQDRFDKAHAVYEQAVAEYNNHEG